MMNDRFSAELRKHLLETADERPARGQLAAIVEGVATTRQRHPLVARLTFNPGRVGPLPSAVFRYGLIAVALIGAALAGALIGAGSAPSRDTAFEGTWTATDPGDGSGMILIVAAGNTPAVYFEDAYASGEACVDTASKRFTAYGTGTVVVDRLDVEWPEGGGCGGASVSLSGSPYRYDRESETLIDSDGLVWARVDADRPPTRGPATEPPATTAPAPDPTPEATAAGSECVDLAPGGTYAAAAGPLSVTATIPSSPLIPWRGWTNQFEVSSECLGASISIHAFPATSGRVQASACMPDASEVADFADAVTRLDAPAGDDISERVDLVIDGHPAARYDVVELHTCPDFGLWGGTMIGFGETGSVYVVDVDGLLVAIELNRDGSQTTAELEEAYAIVAALQFAHGGAAN